MSIARWCNIIIVEASGHDVVCQSCFVNTCAVAVACCCCITSDTFATYDVPAGSMLVAQAATNGLLFGGMMAEIKKLNTRLDAYLKDPKNSLDLSGMKFGAGGARRIAEVLPKWWV